MLRVAAFAAGVTTLSVLAVGPQVMQFAFGDQFEYDRLGLAIVAVGMGFYLVAASAQPGRARTGPGPAGRVPWLGDLRPRLRRLQPARARGDAFRAVEVGFAVAAVLLSGRSTSSTRTPTRRTNSLEPGSGREVEARLAAFDEVG